MKVFFTLLFLFFLQINFGNKLVAQTWINSFEYETFPGLTMNQDSANVGPHEMIKLSDGNILMLSEVNQDEKGELIKIDTSGNLIWSKPAYHSGGVYIEYASALYPTSDTGCVYLFTHDGAFDGWEARRLDKNGNNKWVFVCNQPHVIININQSSNNTTIIQFRDSLLELDEFGNQIGWRSASNNYFVRYTAIGISDLIVTDTNEVRRENFSGTNISWIYNGRYFPIYVDSSFIYLSNYSHDSIIKLQSSSGNLIWKIAHQQYFTSVTSDYGLITSRNKTITLLDSSGNIVWSRTINLPIIRFTSVIESTPSQYITGGQYRCISANHLLNNVDYSAFYASLDSNGHGIIDSTDYFFMGNANDNSVGGFLDDAAYIAVASGSTGYPRIPILQTLTFPAGSYSVFAQDWNQSFFTGANYKYSDVDGNGIIDLTDIATLASYWPVDYPVYPHWRLSARNSTSPALMLDISNDTLIAGDTTTINIILGANSTVIDSVYSIAMNFIGINLIASPVDVELTATQFGDSAINLYKYLAPGSGIINLLIARNDHQNAFVSGDTIARLHFTVDSNATPGVKSILFQATALTSHGFPIQLNLISDNIYLSGTSSVSEITPSGIRVFPNPASEILNIESSKEKIVEFNIVDNLGRVLKNLNNLRNNQVHVSDLAMGVYLVSITTENGRRNSLIYINK